MSPTGYISNMFGRSPVAPLQQHMAKVYSCVLHLNPLFEGVIDLDYDSVLRAHEKIVAGESEADDLKRELRHHLPKGLFMPVDRRDVLDALLMQDKIANQAKDIAGLIVGRRMRLPEDMHSLFIEYGRRCVDAVGQALVVIDELDELVETGFRGPEVERVEEMIGDLNRIEGDTDKLQVRLRAILFEQEDRLKATDVMFTYRLIEWVGNLADLAQRVGSRLQLMLAR